MRIEIIKVALRKNALYYIIQLVILYFVIPLVAYTTLLAYSREQSCRIVVFVAQALLPIFSLLLPMAHFNIWLFSEGWESLVACSNKHQSCSIEVIILCFGMLLLLLPAWGLFCCCYGLLWLELVRLFSQCCLVITFYYVCAVLAKNVTLGAIPVVLYVFMCICVGSNTSAQALSMIELYELANHDSMPKYYVMFVLSGLFICIGATLERINVKRILK